MALFLLEVPSNNHLSLLITLSHSEALDFRKMEHCLWRNFMQCRLNIYKIVIKHLQMIHKQQIWFKVYQQTIRYSCSIIILIFLKGTKAKQWAILIERDDTLISSFLANASLYLTVIILSHKFKSYYSNTFQL